MRGLHPPRAGFTLIELLVVLAILGALTLVALRSVEGLDERARFDATQRALEDARDAILGEWRGDEFQPGFLSDLDRLPGDLSELWLPPDGVATSHPASLPSDPDVLLPAGWRGPYLHLPAGATALFDGWGSDLVLDMTGGGYALRSLGADALPGGDAFDADLSLLLVDPTAGVERTRSEVVADVVVERAPDGLESGDPWELDLTAYMPDPATGELLARDADRVDSEPLPDPVPENFPCSIQFQLVGADALRAGVRAFRAYQRWDDSGSPMGRTSPVLYRTLPSGASTLELVIP